MKQTERIIRHLVEFGEITQIDALKEYGIMRLASRISDLRKEGYIIKTTYENGKNRYGEKTSWAKYVYGGVNHEIRCTN